MLFLNPIFKKGELIKFSSKENRSLCKTLGIIKNDRLERILYVFERKITNLSGVVLNYQSNIYSLKITLNANISQLYVRTYFAFCTCLALLIEVRNN